MLRHQTMCPDPQTHVLHEVRFAGGDCGFDAGFATQHETALSVDAHNRPFRQQIVRTIDHANVLPVQARVGVELVHKRCEAVAPPCTVQRHEGGEERFEHCFDSDGRRGNGIREVGHVRRTILASYVGALVGRKHVHAHAHAHAAAVRLERDAAKLREIKCSTVSRNARIALVGTK